MIKALSVTLCFILCFYGVNGVAHEESTPLGEWLVKDQTAHIRIIACNQGLWGMISWAKDPGRDEHNPDIAKRLRPVIGMPILLGMQRKNDNEWDGNIYNADNGKTYKGSIALKAANVLHVEGCVLGVLCGGEDWTRFTFPSHVPDINCGQAK